MDSSSDSDDIQHYFHSRSLTRKSRRDTPPGKRQLATSQTRSTSPKAGPSTELGPVHEEKRVSLVQNFRNLFKHLYRGRENVDVAITPSLSDVSQHRSTVLNLPTSSGEPRLITVTRTSSGEPRQLILRNVLLSKPSGESNEISLAILTVDWPKSESITTSAGTSGQPLELEDLSRHATLANLNIPTSSHSSRPIPSANVTSKTSKAPTKRTPRRSKRSKSAHNVNTSTSSSGNVICTRSKSATFAENVKPGSSKEPIDTSPKPLKRSFGSKEKTREKYQNPYLPQKRQKIALIGDGVRTLKFIKKPKVPSELVSSTKEGSTSQPSQPPLLVNTNSGPLNKPTPVTAPKSSTQSISIINLNPSQFANKPPLLITLNPETLKKLKTAFKSSVNVNSGILQSATPVNITVSEISEESPVRTQKPVTSTITPTSSHKPILLVTTAPGATKKPLLINVNPSVSTKKPILINVSTVPLPIAGTSGVVGQTPQTSASSAFVKKSITTIPKLVPVEVPAIMKRRTKKKSAHAVTRLVITTTPTITTTTAVRTPPIFNITSIFNKIVASTSATSTVGTTSGVNTTQTVKTTTTVKTTQIVHTTSSIRTTSTVSRSSIVRSTSSAKTTRIVNTTSTINTTPVSTSTSKESKLVIKTTCGQIVSTAAPAVNPIAANPPVQFQRPCMSRFVLQRRRPNETINMGFRRHFLNNPARILELCWVAGCHEVVLLKGCNNCHLTYCLPHLPKNIHRCVQGPRVANICRRYGADYASLKVKCLGLSLQNQRAFPACDCKGNCGICKFFYNYMKYVTDFGVL